MEESNNFLLKLAYNNLRKRASKILIQVQYIPWEKTDKISFLFDATDEDISYFVRKKAQEFAEEGKKIEILGFGGKKGELIFDFPVFYKAKVGSFVPQGDTIDIFIARDADILFVLAYKKIYEIDYILALSQAKLKIATDTYEEFADIVFKVKDNTLESFIDKALEFTKNIKS